MQIDAPDEEMEDIFAAMEDIFAAHEEERFRPYTPANDIAAELAAALRLARDELAHFGEYSVDDALDAADAALAKWEARK